MKIFSFLKTSKNFIKTIFKALETQIARFVSGKIQNAHFDFRKNLFLKAVSAFIQQFRNRKLHIAYVTFCVLLLGAGSTFAANYSVDIPPEYEYQTINIFPSSVTGSGWGNVNGTFTQDATDDALFSFFNEQNSAFIVPFITEVSTPPS